MDFILKLTNLSYENIYYLLDFKICCHVDNFFENHCKYKVVFIFVFCNLFLFLFLDIL